MIFQLRANQAIAIVAASFAAIAFALVFMLSPDVLLSARDSDMTSEFVSWRAYLAETLHAGHLPLWNPFTYAGQPFLGGFESAVLYPPNLLFAFMPLARALNFVPAHFASAPIRSIMLANPAMVKGIPRSNEEFETQLPSSANVNPRFGAARASATNFLKFAVLNTAGTRKFSIMNAGVPLNPRAVACSWLRANIASISF